MCPCSNQLVKCSKESKREANNIMPRFSLGNISITFFKFIMSLLNSYKWALIDVSSTTWNWNNLFSITSYYSNMHQIKCRKFCYNVMESFSSTTSVSTSSNRFNRIMLFTFSMNSTLLAYFIIFGDLSLPSNASTKPKGVNKAHILMLHNPKLYLLLNFSIFAFAPNIISAT